MSDVLLPANEYFTPLESIPQSPVNTPASGQVNTQFSSYINSLLNTSNVNNSTGIKPSPVAGALPAATDEDSDGTEGLPQDGKLLPFPLLQAANPDRPLPLPQDLKLSPGVAPGSLNPQTIPSPVNAQGSPVPNPQPANPLQAGLPGISATGITPLPATEAEPASETTASVASDQETASTRNLLEMIRNTLAQADRPVMAGVAQGTEQGTDGKDSTQAMNLVPGLSIQPQDSLPVNDPQLRVQLAAAIKDQVRILSQHSSSGAHDFSNQPGNENLQHQQATHTQGNVERGQFVLQTRPADTYMLQTGVQKQEWAGELGNRVTMMAKDGLELAHLRLNPANLGTLEVRISVQNDQAQVHFLSQHAHVRDALEASLPRLREMMHDGGLSLGDVNISDQSPAREQDNSGRGFQRNSNLFSAALPDTEVLPQIMDMKVHNPRGVDFYA